MTNRVELYTYVTCPTMRYHPSVVAQKAATIQLLADGRFTLGLGSGENLNEHVIGEGWPAVDARQQMLAEAIEIIRALHTGELVTHDGEYFRVDSARIWDLPDGGIPIGVAAGGPEAIEAFGTLGDHLIATEPSADLIAAWNNQEGTKRIGKGAKAIGQIPIPCGDDLDAIVAAVRPYWEAGFTDIALVQIGDELQERFLNEAAEPLLEKLRAAAG